VSVSLVSEYFQLSKIIVGKLIYSNISEGEYPAWLELLAWVYQRAIFGAMSA